MDKPYFVMIRSQHGEGGYPMVDADDEVKFFETAEDAEQAAHNHSWASSLGYRVFDMEEGDE